MKESTATFEEATGTWFIQGTDPERLAQLDADSADYEEPTACGPWSAMMSRLHDLLRR